MEKKHFEFTAEIKAIGDANGIGQISGYGSVFGNVDSYGDIVLPEAFTRSLSERMPKMFWSHDPAHPIGVWKSAKADATGLMLEGELNLEVQKGREAYSLLKQGAFSGLSIGYMVNKSSYDKDGHRLLSDIDLFEVSLVTLPANQVANVTSVKAEEPPKSEREFEAFLRDVGGYSREAAKAIVAKGFRPFIREQRDVASDEVIDGLKKAISLLSEMQHGTGSKRPD